MNTKNTGFIDLPKELRSKFSKNQQVLVSIQRKNLTFYAKIKEQNHKGIYVPSDLVCKSKLLEGAFEISLKRINGFSTKVTSDGRIYLPKNIVQQVQLNKGEIVKVCAEIEGKTYGQYSVICSREKEKTTEYSIAFDSATIGKSGIFQLEDVVSRNKTTLNQEMKEILKDFNYAQLDNERLVVFYGNRVPIIINKNIQIEKLAYYLGCYFSDGTKRGNSWGIVASTFEQANFFLEMHKSIVPDAFTLSELSFSWDGEGKAPIKEITNAWLQKTGVNVENRIRVRNILSTLHSKRNEYGSLVIKEHRQLVLLYYNRLISALMTRIFKGDKDSARNFLLGCFEGDGSPSSKTHGHIVLASSRDEHEILAKIAKVAEMSSKVFIEQQNRFYLRFHSLGLLSKFLIIGEQIFRYYPKRRKKFIERLSNIGAARYILGKSITSGWVKNELRDAGLLNKGYKLTKKGEEIRMLLIKTKNEVNQNG